jgi:hypothetical protein
MRHLRLAPVVCAIVAAVCAARPSWAEGPEPVVVTNFPAVQQISRRVVVSEPIPQTRFKTVKALVTPAATSAVNDWTEAGALETEGFTQVTLSLAGTLQGSPQAGSIGVVLIPDVPELLNALRTHGVAPSALRVEVEISASLGGFFGSASIPLRIGFPRYRVFLYNATSKTAEAVLYAYLSGS